MIGNDARKSHALSTLKSEFDSQFAYIISNSTLAQALNRTGIVLDVTTKCAQILASWDPFYRYSDSNIWDEPMSEIYQQEANECAKVIGRMKSAGLIS